MRIVHALVWLAAAALCCALFAGAVHHGVLSPIEAWAHYGGTLIGMTAGIVVWARRPESRTGPLIVAGLLCYLSGDLFTVFPASVAAVTLAYATFRLSPGVLVQTYLSYPTGRLGTRLERWFVAVVYTVGAVVGLAYASFYDPRAPFDADVYLCPSCAVPLSHVAWGDVLGARGKFNASLLILMIVFVVLLVRKLVRAASGPRRVLVPVSIAAVVIVAQFGVELVLWLSGSSADFWSSPALFWSGTLTILAIPLAFAAGVLWGQSARAAVADLVVELERTPPGSVRDALALTLGDPTLELALWMPERHAYVDADGRPCTLPAQTPGRAVYVIGEKEAPIAALLHDPALTERGSLLHAAAAAARLALENERLQADLRAQLTELRASRARIVAAGDAERRRLERNLHDGAQQQLLTLGLALQLARRNLGPDADGAAELLDEADGALRTALDELHELACGIHPAILTDQGLPAALQALASRAPIPVAIVELPDSRLPGPTEAAIYFLACEALANVAKYAHASRVQIGVARRDGRVVAEIADNGAGGANPAAGSGLRGLADRFQALDGTLVVDSPAGHGTRLHGELPCA